jgi:hypothetical protein
MSHPLSIPNPRERTTVKAPLFGIIAMVCAIVLSGALVTPARAINLNMSSHYCQQSDLPQTDIIRTASGIATLDTVDTPRYVTCTVVRSPLPVDWTSGGWLWVDGDNKNGAQTSCTLSSYTFLGALQGSVSFTSTINGWYDSYLPLPYGQMGYYDYLTLTCLLPPHGNGALRGITSVQ